MAIQCYLRKEEKHQQTPKTTGKRTTTTATTKNKISRRKENIKIRAEINEKEIKETILQINNTKSWFLRR